MKQACRLLPRWMMCKGTSGRVTRGRRGIRLLQVCRDDSLIQNRGLSPIVLFFLFPLLFLVLAYCWQEPEPKSHLITAVPGRAGVILIVVASATAVVTVANVLGHPPGGWQR